MKEAYQSSSSPQQSKLHVATVKRILNKGAFVPTHNKKRKVASQQQNSTRRNGRTQVSFSQIEADRKSAIVLAQNEWRVRHPQRKPQRPRISERLDAGILQNEETDVWDTVGAGQEEGQLCGHCQANPAYASCCRLEAPLFFEIMAKLSRCDLLCTELRV
jgi:hypothetical protein